MFYLKHWFLLFVHLCSFSRENDLYIYDACMFVTHFLVSEFTHLQFLLFLLKFVLQSQQVHQQNQLDDQCDIQYMYNTCTIHE